MKVQLQIRYAEAAQHGPAQPGPAQREPAAWFVSGATAEDWLGELAGGYDVAADARLIIVPTTEFNRTPCGALVLGARPRDGKPSPGAVPYAVIADRLYLPVDARLDPDVDPRELRELLADSADADEVFVWHPSAGLISRHKSQAPAVADLAAAEIDETTPWNLAVPGVALNARLTSIEPEFATRAADVIESGRGDIGRESPELEKLPPAPGETQPAGDGVGRAMGRGMFQALQWLMRQGPQGGSTPGWMQSIGDWAGRQLDGLSEKLDSVRRREIERLMNLLKDDPDEGLRFALPMNGGDSRGVAPPSGFLGQRNVDFSLDNFRGGGPADVWQLPHDYQAELIRRYRELAAREVSLGRHRRAAYIFASLLGDFRSAANTLADGGHYREAAALYEEKLNQPAEAARCLRRGGLWTEAIALYSRLGEFEIVGDIHQELEQREEAEAAFRKAVDVRLDASDVLAAARILEFKLASCDEAFEHLQSAWPRSKQAAACLTEGFGLLARHGRHDETEKLVTWLAETQRRPDMVVPLVEILAREARTYPHNGVRRRAADQTRIVAADRLAADETNQSDAKRLVDAVTGLVAADRLLERDGLRYLRNRAQAEPKRKPTLRDRLSIAREFWLPQLDWRSAAAGYDAVYAAGVRDRELVVMRVGWNGVDPQEPIGLKWQVEPAFIENPIMLAVDPLGSSPPIVHVAGSPPPPNPRWFRTSDPFPEPVSVGSHRGVGASTHAFCYSARETFHTLELGDDLRLVVNGYFGDHSQLAGIVSIDFTELLEEDDPPAAPLPMTVVEDSVIIALGRKLCFARPNRPQQVLELPHPITRLSASPAQSRVRVFVTMTQGAVMLWGHEPDAGQTPLASEMTDPCLALSRDGMIIAASKDEIDVYTGTRERMRLLLRAPGPGWKPLAALTPRHANQFALFAPDGRTVVYDLPST